jgi:probable F420-dependent oxidoreductase
MRLGLRLPQRTGVDLQHDIVETARTAEAAGFDSLWVFERLLFPVAPKEGYGVPGADWPESHRQTADPLAVLTAAAVATTTVRLGTSVLVAPLHIPIQLAKSLATIDQISGGRVVAGLATGWSTDELQAAGVTRADRGRLLDETMDVFEVAWGPDPVVYRGRSTVIDNAYVLPKPASTIPVMLGGGDGPKTLARIARRGDGWLSLGSGGVEAETATWERIRDLTTRAGRDPDRIEHVVCANITFTDQSGGEGRPPFVGTFGQVTEDILAFAEAGADEIIVDLNLQDWFSDARQMLDTAQEIQELVTAAGY